MEEGVTIAKVPDWMKLKPKMMRHLIREHEKLGRTLTEEEFIPTCMIWTLFIGVVLLVSTLTK